MTKQEILGILKEEKIHFFRLQFCDVNGMMKNVGIPKSQIEKALDGEMMFDGSSIDGFARIEESDMYLKPDFDTFSILPCATRKVFQRQGLCVMSIRLIILHSPVAPV